jgi:transcriptional regulator with XRE-family HTH domain
MSEGWLKRLKAAVDADGRTPRAISLAAGVNPNYLSELFTLDKQMAVDKLLKLCDALNISAAWVLTGLKASRREEEMLAILSQLPDRAALSTTARARGSRASQAIQASSDNSISRPLNMTLAAYSSRFAVRR